MRVHLWMLTVLGWIGAGAVAGWSAGLPPLSYDQRYWVDATLDRLSLNELVGQLFIVRHTDARVLDDIPFAGIYFSSSTRARLPAATNRLQQRSPMVPLLMFCDFEFGAGMRVQGATVFPINMALGATRNPELVRQLAVATAHEGRALGIHSPLAPVVDIASQARNPIVGTRAYSDSSALVSVLAQASLTGYFEGGMLPTLKHFPGHGNTTQDSHLVLPVINTPSEILLTRELLPYQLLARDVRTASIMVGHLWLENIDPIQRPATVSPPVVNHILRGQLGYRGLVISDALDMQGVTTYGSQREVLAQALEAGVDLFLAPPHPQQAIHDVLRLVEEDPLVTVERIQHSARKILAWKAFLNLHQQPLVDETRVADLVGAATHLNLALYAAQQSLTLLRKHESFPIAATAETKLVCVRIMQHPFDFIEMPTPVFCNELKNIFPNTQTFLLNTSSSDQTRKDFLAVARRADHVVVGVFAWVGVTHKKTRETIAQLCSEEGPPVHLVSFGSPHLITAFPAVDTYLCAYSSASVSQLTAARACAGQQLFTGVLPVTIPGFFEFGAGGNGDILPARH